jgi:hypothetical protein
LATSGSVENESCGKYGRKSAGTGEYARTSPSFRRILIASFSR